MYKCFECGEVFDEPKYIREHHPELPENAYETFSVCPNCGGYGFDDATRCELCGEYCLDVELEDDVCLDCLHEAMKDPIQMLDFFSQDDNLSDLAQHLKWRAKRAKR